MDNKPTVQIMRTNGQDFDRILAFFAGFAAVDEARKHLERRVRLIPGGWRDLCLVHAKLDKLTKTIMETIPPEKRRNLIKMGHRSKFHIVLGPQATQTASADEALLGFDDLDVLVLAAREQCKMCTDWSRGKCSRCELGKTLDRVLRYDRNGKDWDTISDEDIANE